MEDDENWHEDNYTPQKEDEQLEWDNYQEGVTEENPIQEDLKWNDSEIKSIFETIEDENLRDRLLNVFQDEEEPDYKKIKNILLDRIDKVSILEDFKFENWDDFIITEEKKKLLWEQKVKNFNSVLSSKDIFLDPKDKNIMDFFDKYITETLTEKRKEINGYNYLGEKTIQRGKLRTFHLIESPIREEFIKKIREVINGNAKATILNEVGLVINTKEFARDYVMDLREAQREILEKGSTIKDLPGEIIELNKIGKDIENIKKNKRFKFRREIWKKSAAGSIARLYRWAKANKGKLGFGLFSMLAGLAVSLATGIPTMNHIRRGLNQVKELGKTVKKLGESLKKSMKDISAYLNIPGQTLNNIFFFVGSLLFFIGKILGRTFSMVIPGLVSIIISFFGSVSNTSNVVEKTGTALMVIGANIVEEAYFMGNQKPPIETVEILAEDKNETDEEWRKKNIKTEYFYDSSFFSFLSYPMSFVGKFIENVGLIIKSVSFIANNLFLILVIIIIIKWRT